MTNSNTNTVVGIIATANGNQPFTSLLSGASTGLSSPFGVAFDTSANMYVANESTNSVTVYAPPYNGNVAPIPADDRRRGDDAKRTRRLLAFDAAGNLYVCSYAGSVAVFAPGANGNVAPIRNITEFCHNAGRSIGNSAALGKAKRAWVC